MHVIDQGSGAPVVLLPANGHDSRDFADVLPELSNRYRVITVDWPGFGRTPAPQPPGSASAGAFAADLAALVERLDLPAAHLIGNSLGAYTAARLAIEAPHRVRSLVLVSVGGFPALNAADRLVIRLKGRPGVTRLINRRFAASYLHRRTPLTREIIERATYHRGDPRADVDAAIWRSFLKPDFDLGPRAAQITAPTLVAWGRHDPVFGRRARAEVARRLPDARTVTFDTGHVPFAEDPRAFLAEVLPFLDGVDRSIGVDRSLG
ncbi:alpha/beta fold hydrolase [Krasilnikovia sp. M28-CT-15]|uniref:alpha/beta fold hydrolase n=1 Tax=Krasilnikovia sp. M28-CT-15 TaxID=3373540 RepID=UPI003876A095